MELKLKNNIALAVLKIVLIVPYGIETTDGFGNRGSLLVLIVPYGIETCKGDQPERPLPVLIVPYGIETFNCKG